MAESGSVLRIGMGGSVEFRGDEGRRLWAAARAAGVDHLMVGDHVSFFVGIGFDGLISATGLLALADDVECYVGVYLLPLRHPVLVARQLADISGFAPGRLTLGVGVGGEDRHEIAVCGVDPATRGRRMDESLEVLRRLLTGEPVDHHGEFFDLDGALIIPAPRPPVPLVVGGRSSAAVRRAGRLGDGWIGIWVSARRYTSVVQEIAEISGDAGRGDVEMQHAMQMWVGVGASKEEARERLAPSMQAVYQLPFEVFERYSPHGTAEDIAEQISPYIEAGCRRFNLIPGGVDAETMAGTIGEVKRLLGAVRAP